MLTHANVVRTAVIPVQEMKCTAADVFFVAVPVFHVFELVPSIYSTVASDLRMILMKEYISKARFRNM